ncbi:antitoxin [Sinomonas halotolerans]|uniref:Antitoxin n=1 Tax=Sinomonas halotolerans TaxID=1644133 RepID=A0ABU9X1C4_9MICC
MSLLDDMKGKAEELIAGNSDAVRDGIGKVGDFIDDKTGGKYAGQVDGAQQAASDYVDGVGRTGGAAPQEPSAPAEA